MQVERDMCFLFALDYLKRALDFSNALVYNLLRKRIGRDAGLPSVSTIELDEWIDNETM